MVLFAPGVGRKFFFFLGLEEEPNRVSTGSMLKGPQGTLIGTRDAGGELWSITKRE